MLSRTQSANSRPEPAGAGPAIQVAGLSVALGGQPVLDGLDFAIAQGEWLGVIGPNGAGKTTLLRALAGLAFINKGSAKVLGHEVNSLHSRRRARILAVVSQDPVIPSGMTVVDYVLLGRNPHIGTFGVETARDYEVVNEVLNDLDLLVMFHRKVQTLSGGERQRVILARALAQEAPILLLDEPTTGLDIGHVQDALELVDSLRVARGLTVMSAMHDLTTAAHFADRLMMIDAGKVVAIGQPKQVLTPDLISAHYRVRVRVADDPIEGLSVVPLRTKPNPGLA